LNEEYKKLKVSSIIVKQKELIEKSKKIPI